MKRNKQILILIFSLFASLLFHSELHAQDREKISGLFPGIPFPRFAQQVNSMTGYRFYYSMELQGFQVNISAKENTLTQILEAIFDQTDFKFSIDSENRVFITKNTPLDLRLSKDFFDRLKTDGEADSLNRQSDIERAYSRNKLYVIGNPSNQKEVNAVLNNLQDRCLAVFLQFLL
jgi:type II secretory pathway component GspD/PulD (secretin)